MNNNLSHIPEIIRIYSKNYVSNNPTWDQELLVNNIRDKASFKRSSRRNDSKIMQ